MKMQLFRLQILLCLAMALCSQINVAQSADFASSTGKQAGDLLRLTTDVYGFVPVSTAPGIDQSPRCAGKNSRFTVVNVIGTNTVVKFFDLIEPLSEDTCTSTTPRIHEGSVYKIPNESYAAVQSKTTGVAYGGLLVPFKFRLGSDKKIVSSVTAAPYIGLRHRHLQFLGFEVMPVASAGLGMVPITDPVSKTTETKAAFSLAAGLTLTTIKDNQFSAGILYGKDFLSSTDKASDPNASKPWASLWFGVSL